MAHQNHEYYKQFWSHDQINCEESRSRLETLRNDPTNNIPQRTPAWYTIRKNVLTASSFYDLCVTRGAAGARLLNEKLYPERVKSFDSLYGKTHSYALFHGCRCESVILPFYEWLTGRKVYEFGLVKSDRVHFVAASPDGVNDAGVMVEFKCPVSRKIVPNKVPAKYLAQIYGQLYACNLKHCDYFEAVIVRIPTEEMWLEHKTTAWWSKKAILIFTLNSNNEVNDKLNWVSDFNATPEEAVVASDAEWQRRRDLLEPDEFIETFYCIVKEVNHVAVTDANKVMEKDMLPRLTEAYSLMCSHSAEQKTVPPLKKLPKFLFDAEKEGGDDAAEVL